MAEAVIGALRVVLGADSAALSKGLDDARGSMGKFASDIAVTGAAIAAAITAAYAAAALGVSNTLKSMDEIGKQSQKIGIPVEQLSALRLAADLSDVSMESLGKGMGKLSQAMVEAASKPTSEAANAFRALGVSVKDSSGQLRPVIDVTQSIATKFEGLKDGAGKTAASMAIFGKAGADLIPLLNAGGSGLADMMANAQKLGIVFDTETAKSAEKFRDTLTTLGAAKDGIIVKLTAHLLPALQMFADRMLAAAMNSDKQQQKLSFLTTAFDALSRGVLLVCDNFKILLQLGAVFVAANMISMVVNLGIAFIGLARAIQATGLVMAAVEAIRKISLTGWLIMAGGIAVLTGNFDTMKEKLSEIGGAISSALPDSSGALGKALKGLGLDLSALTVDLTKMKDANSVAAKSQTDFNFAAMAGKNAVDQFINSQTKHLEGQRAEVATFGMLAGAQEAMKLEYQALAIATANNTTLTDTQRAALDALKLKATETAQELAGLQMKQANLAPAQAFQLEQAKIQGLFDAGKISAETYGQAMQKAGENAAATWDLAGASIAGSFATIAGSFGKESSAMASAAKVFGIIQGTISMYTGAAKALELPFPANIAAMAAVLAQGAKLVSSIKGQSVPTGMMTGGSMTVQGNGGVDSVPVQFMASPGEQIDVWRPDQGGGADPRRGGSNGGAKTIVLQGMVWGRDQIRDLVAALNEGDRDGIKLVFS
jgi:hypothetical protein